MASPSIVAIGTTEGGYLLSRGMDEGSWKSKGPFLKGESVNNMSFNRRTGRLFAATHTDGVFVSDDLGSSWKRSNNGLHIKKTWTIEVDAWNPSTIYVGTHYSHLFRSVDEGENWQDVAGLFSAPKRNEWEADWGFGT